MCQKIQSRLLNKIKYYCPIEQCYLRLKYSYILNKRININQSIRSIDRGLQQDRLIINKQWPREFFEFDLLYTLQLVQIYKSGEYDILKQKYKQNLQILQEKIVQANNNLAQLCQEHKSFKKSQNYKLQKQKEQYNHQIDELQINLNQRQAKYQQLEEQLNQQIETNNLLQQQIDIYEENEQYKEILRNEEHLQQEFIDKQYQIQFQAKANQTNYNHEQQKIHEKQQSQIIGMLQEKLVNLQYDQQNQLESFLKEKNKLEILLGIQKQDFDRQQELLEKQISEYEIKISNNKIIENDQIEAISTLQEKLDQIRDDNQNQHQILIEELKEKEQELANHISEKDVSDQKRDLQKQIKLTNDINLLKEEIIVIKNDEKNQIQRLNQINKEEKKNYEAQIQQKLSEINEFKQKYCSQISMLQNKKKLFNSKHLSIITQKKQKFNWKQQQILQSDQQKILNQHQHIQQEEEQKNQYYQKVSDFQKLQKQAQQTHGSINICFVIDCPNNNNNGYIDNSQSDQNHFAQAFSIFSYYYSHFTIMICDLQGAYPLFTDPAINTIEGRFDQTDLGQQGINNYLVNSKEKDSAKNIQSYWALTI